MRKVAKVLLYIICSILLLVLTAALCLNSQWGQNIVRKQAEDWLEKKLQTEVKLGFLGVGFPKNFVIRDVLLRDKAKDTLLSLRELKVDIGMWGLLRAKVAVQYVSVDGLTSHVYRNDADTAFNFGFIVDAFAGGDAAAEKASDSATGEPMKINVGEIQLTDIHLRFQDALGAMRAALDLTRASLQMKETNLEKMRFHVGSLLVSGLSGEYEQAASSLPEPEQKSGSADLTLMADDVNLQDIDFKYADDVSQLLFALQLGKLQLQLDKLGLGEQIVDVGKLSLSNTDVKIVTSGQTADTAVKENKPEPASSQGWVVNAAELLLDKVNFVMDDESAVRKTEGIDYAHLNVHGISLDAQNIHYSPEKISGSLGELSLGEQCGLVLHHLRTDFVYEATGVALDKFYLETDNTVLRDNLIVRYPSIDVLSDNLQLMSVDINLENSRVGLRDVLLFAPDMKHDSLLGRFKDEQLQLTAAIIGQLDSLIIDRLLVAALRNTVLSLDTSIVMGLPDMEQLRYAVNISGLQSTASDIASVIPDSLLTAVRLPESFTLAGNLSGTTKDVLAAIFLNSSDGQASLSGYAATSEGKGKERYHLTLSTGNLNIGRILRQDSTLGNITLSAEVKGTGFAPESMDATVDATVQEAFVMGYRYHDIALYGGLSQQQSDINLMSNDPNVRLLLKAHADLRGIYPAAAADIRIDSLDVHALGLSSSPFRLSGTMHADFPDLNPDYPKGKFIWWEPTLNIDGKKYYPDSISIVSTPGTDKSQHISIDLGVLRAKIDGHIPLTNIAPAVMEQIDRHYSIGKRDTPGRHLTQTPDNYSLKIVADIVDRPVLHGLLPDLVSFEPIHIAGDINERSMGLDINIPEAVYSGTVLEKASIALNTGDAALNYRIHADKVEVGGVSLWSANVAGNLQSDRITANVSVKDKSGKDRFVIAAGMEQKDTVQEIQLLPGLVLDYQEWTVAQPNKIELSDSGIYVRNFIIANGSQYISIKSKADYANAPMNVAVRNFKLSNITQALSNNDTLLAAGLLNATIDVTQFKPVPQIEGEMRIDGLSVLGDTVGNLSARISNTRAEELTAQLNLIGSGNDIELKGKYFTQTHKGDDFDFDLNVNALAINSIQHIAQNQIKNSSGYLRGRLRLNGTTSAPKLNGELRTDKLATTISMLNARFSMPSEKIIFTDDGISFRDFTIHDESENIARLNGSVDMRNPEQTTLDLKLRADDWRALHSTSKDNKLFYGDLLLSANVDLSGSPSAPNIGGTIKVLKGTDVTVVNPESAPVVDSRKGIVEFVNMSDTGRHRILVNSETEKPTKTVTASSDVNVNISVDKSAKFNLVIDPASGDYMSVQGAANLNAGILPGGTINLAGSYELTDGVYEMNYNFVKRKFKIAKGSTVLFAGDPVKGTKLNITAVYKSQIAPYDLVQQQVTDPAQLNYYKQRLPFDVNLYMNGPVMKPGLTFDIALSEGEVYRMSSDKVDVVQGKLSQIRTDTSELNKQVFAVLLLNRFLSDDPFSTQGARGGAQATALQSVSSFIGDQLNRAAGKLVKGVEFSVDLATTDDYTTGELRQRTDLNLAASKRLLNDRLKITLGNNFELEGPQEDNNNTSYIPSNLAADYLLTADGKYILRAYRKAYDVGVLQGYVTEAGLNFIASFEYNKFKHAFRDRNKKREKENKSKN